MKKKLAIPLNIQFFAEEKDPKQPQVVSKSELVKEITDSVLAQVSGEFTQEVKEDIMKDVSNSLETFEKNVNQTAKDEANSVYKNVVMNLGAQEKEETPKEEKGIGLARIIKLAHKASNDPEKMLFFAKGPKGQEAHKGMYSDNPTFIKTLENGMKQMTVGSNADGGFLVTEQYATDIVELLRERVFLFSAGARRLPMPNGNINMPVHTAGALSHFRGEGKPAVPSDPKFGSIKASSKIQDTLVVMSNELLNSNSYNADRRIRDDMLREAAIVMEFTALYGSGTDYTPLGLANKPGITTVALDGALLNTTLPVIKGEILQTNVPQESLAWVFNGALWAPIFNLQDGNGSFLYQNMLNAGNLLNDPYYLFNRVPIGQDANGRTDLFYGDWSEFEVAEQEMFAVETSREASITYPGGTRTINLFQNGMTAIKMTSWYDFLIRHAEGFVRYTGVNTK